ncbi:DUF2202 domain-containing protein [Archaeoglobus neptunius]|uniref:DUF2202 domain-containing protein n=1 Tax=Archaeoglobus neptunius TaxID=2798580 RepID=UPI00192652E9|nr:DUF2202 domain-containing protein [Archaeoglobus neptunius]
MVKKVGMLLLATFIVALVAGCVQNEQTPNTPAPAGHGNGGGGMSVENMKQLIYQVPAGELSEAEKDGILHMREEEKLARDVYQTLYDKWGLQIFSNIAKSEQTHMDAVKLLIDKYGLEDPAEGKGVGEFTNPAFTELYNKLVAEGSKSTVDALKVGALIEEIDIVDLQKYLSETSKEDIKIVYENLMKGSRNHLRAFTSMLEKYGESYNPQYLSKEEYEQIISSPMEKGLQ